MTMKCTIYRVGSQDGTYVYLREGLDLTALPPELQQRASRMARVMDLDLGPRRKLARVDIQQVLEGLEKRGWYLQLPPDGKMHVSLHFGD
ncbi:YcgL domain-containing protein [Panacagrimonas perspica]|nr:YcgL domain-containing protein [Panacagrimonas perspica]